MNTINKIQSNQEINDILNLIRFIREYGKTKNVEVAHKNIYGKGLKENNSNE